MSMIHPFLDEPNQLRVGDMRDLVASERHRLKAIEASSLLLAMVAKRVETT